MSILRWSGSKTRLLSDLRRLAPRDFQRYIEPFAGSASLFFEIAPKNAILGDVNPCVIDMYRAIKLDASRVADTLDGIPRTAEAFYMLRELSPADLTLSQRAARLIFLMKACFNGVYRTNKQGKFNVPMGDKIYAIPSREELLGAQKLLEGTELFHADFAKTTSLCDKEDWVYLDPPYKSQGRYRGEYGYDAEFCSMQMTSLVSMAEKLSERGCLVTISYSYDEELIEKLSGWNINPVYAQRSVARSLSKRGAAREIIITNYESLK